jgi:hypothetical protein
MGGSVKAIALRPPVKHAAGLGIGLTGSAILRPRTVYSLGKRSSIEIEGKGGW